MIQEYRCERCRHLLFKGSLSLLLAKRHGTTSTYIEPKCPTCGLVNRFAYAPSRNVTT